MTHGLVLGKFLPYHAGHAHLIRRARGVEEAAALEANRVLICDTDLVTTCTWSDMITGVRTPWLDRAAKAQQYSLTLLLDDDVPWIDDGTRVLERRRAEHTARLREALDAAGRRYEILRGSYQDRVASAVQHVERLIASRPLDCTTYLSW